MYVAFCLPWGFWIWPVEVHWDRFKCINLNSQGQHWSSAAVWIPSALASFPTTQKPKKGCRKLSVQSPTPEKFECSVIDEQFFLAKNRQEHGLCGDLWETRVHGFLPHSHHSQSELLRRKRRTIPDTYRVPVTVGIVQWASCCRTLSRDHHYLFSQGGR
jgi:hypothetical protein